MQKFSWRWLAAAVFIFSSTLNYLDRNLLSVLAPVMLAEFHMRQVSYGYILSASSFVYAFSSLGAGYLLDRFGLNRTVSTAIGWWSSAGILTAATTGFSGLLAARVGLAVGESAGVPAFGKFNGMYLKPSERALGTASNQIGLALGGALAAAAVPLAVAFNWRVPFVICGVLGLLWIPLWLWTSHRIAPANEFSPVSAAAEPSIFRHRDLWVLVAANVLWMGGYSLWNNWTPLYLVHVLHVPFKETGHYIWIPQLVSSIGGFFGGWLSFRWINRRIDAVKARRWAIWVSAIGALAAWTLPFANTPALATTVISISFFFCLAGSVNIYALPLDIFGARHAGMAIAALTFAFGLLQTVISPLIGWLGDHNLYSQVVWIVTLPLLVSAALLHGLRTNKELP